MRLRNTSGGELLSTTEPHVIDDLIVLGRAVSEHISGGRVIICVAGYSPCHGFIRIYPTTYDSPLKRWNIVRVPVEKNPHDSREESWKIQGSNKDWDRLAKKIEVVDRLPEKRQPDLVTQLLDGCVKDINIAHRSLGIVQPREIIKTYFKEERRYDATFQETLLGGFRPRTNDEYERLPYVRYRCSECKVTRYHDQQLLEWGVFEWIRKNPRKAEQVWDNLGLKSPDWVPFFFVGNQFQTHIEYPKYHTEKCGKSNRPRESR